MTKQKITRRCMIGGVAAGVGLAAAAGDIIGAARARSVQKQFLTSNSTVGDCQFLLPPKSVK
jgi:hypothetical protein